MNRLHFLLTSFFAGLGTLFPWKSKINYERAIGNLIAGKYDSESDAMCAEYIGLFERGGPLPEKFRNLWEWENREWGCFAGKTRT